MVCDRDVEAYAYPQLRLDLGVLDDNIERMATWCGDRDVQLVPHIKTTMSRPVVRPGSPWATTRSSLSDFGVAFVADAPDAGLPVVLRSAEATSGPIVAELFDHHALVRGRPRPEIGEVVALGISHPCSAFSRWEEYLVVRGGEVVDRWTTDFVRRAASTRPPGTGVATPGRPETGP